VERNLPRAVDLADTVGGLEPAHLKSHSRHLMPLTRAKHCIEKRRYFVPEGCLEVSLSISAEMCIICGMGHFVAARDPVPRGRRLQP